MESKVSILSPRVEFAKTDMRFSRAMFQNWGFRKLMLNGDVSFSLFSSERSTAIY